MCKYLRPFAIEYIAMPMEAGASEETYDDISDIIVVRLEIAGIALHQFLQLSQIFQGWGF